MRHYFEFDGVKSSDFGVFISGAQTMGAAGRDVDEIVVPGMDGNLTIDNGRFNAVAHTYPAFIAEDAKEGLKGLRNALLSKRGHKRLSDTVHPDEFYRAYYEHGLEPELTANLRHSELEIEFTRDPRRFLVSGDTPQDVSVTTETLSGSSVTFENNTGADMISGMSVEIVPAQSGSGDPSPTNIRPITGWMGAQVVRTGKNLIDDLTATIYPRYFNSSNKWGYASDSACFAFRCLPNTTYTISAYNPNLTIFRTGYIKTDIPTSTSGTDWPDIYSIVKKTASGSTVITTGADATYIVIQVNSAIATARTTQLQIEYGSTATAYETGHVANLPITWSDTAGMVYGGTLDVTTGVLTVDKTMVDLGSLTWDTIYTGSVNKTVSATLSELYYQKRVNVIAEQWQYIGSVSGASALNNPDSRELGVRTYKINSATDEAKSNTIYVVHPIDTPLAGKIIYELSTPTTVQLDPQTVAVLVGENNIWADCGDVSVTLQLPATLINPTLFASSPKIRVHGQGTLYIGNTAITVGGSFPYVDIDTEIADCSYEGQNANQYVTFSGLDFPKLEPGENYITYTGFTAVEVTPRWWRL